MKVKVLAAIALTLIVAVPIGFGYLMNIENVDRTVYNEIDSTNISGLINNTTKDVYTTYEDINNNKACYEEPYDTSLDFVTHGSTKTSVYYYYNTGSSTNTVPNGDYGVYTGAYYTFSILDTKVAGLRYTDPGGVTHNIGFSPSGVTLIFERLPTGYLFAGHQFPIESTNVILTVTGGPINIVYKFLSYDYAYQASGWHAPGTPGVDVHYGHRYYWYNGQNNESIKLSVNLVEPSITYLTPHNSTLYNRLAELKIEKEASGNVAISTYDNYLNGYALIDSADLGDYQYIQITITEDKVKVDGIDSWPSFTDNPRVYNTVELDANFPFYNGMFDRLGFGEEGTNTGANIFRVDQAFIKAGTYPAANNATITPTSIYPNMTNCQLTISKIGILGDSITFGGETFPISRGQIEVNSKKVNVEGISLRSVTEDGITWSYYINDHLVDTGASISNISLGGVWSAIYTISNLDQETQNSPEWVAGGFAFNTSWFSIVGLGTCAALTVILGMYGARSGTKVLWLMLVTGGAAVVFLLMI